MSNTRTNATLRVLIVGGGIAGLALARALGRRELQAEIDIVERSPEWPHGGTGLYLPGNVHRALQRLGLHEAVAARSVAIEQQRFLDHRGRTLLEISLPQFWRNPCVGMQRANLHELLRAKVDGVRIRFGTTIETLSVDMPARVTFNDGSTKDYDLVVGADGIHSSVRRLVFGGSAPQFVGQLSWRFLIGGFDDITSWSVMLGRGKAFLTVPVGGGLTYCYSDINATEQSDPTGGELDRLRALFAEFAHPVDRILERLDAPAVYFSPIEEVSQRPWVKGRAVLIGDAAHATSPNMAEGVAMALEDALVLAELLSTDQPLETSLAMCESRRAARVDWVRRQTHRRDRTRNLPSMVRSVVLRAAGGLIYKSQYRPLLEMP